MNTDNIFKSAFIKRAQQFGIPYVKAQELYKRAASNNNVWQQEIKGEDGVRQFLSKAKTDGLQGEGFKFTETNGEDSYKWKHKQ